MDPSAPMPIGQNLLGQLQYVLENNDPEGVIPTRQKEQTTSVDTLRLLVQAHAGHNKKAGTIPAYARGTLEALLRRTINKLEQERPKFGRGRKRNDGNGGKVSKRFEIVVNQGNAHVLNKGLGGLDNAYIAGLPPAPVREKATYRARGSASTDERPGSAEPAEPSGPPIEAAAHEQQAQPAQINQALQAQVQVNEGQQFIAPFKLHLDQQFVAPLEQEQPQPGGFAMFGDLLLGDEGNFGAPAQPQPEGFAMFGDLLLGDEGNVGAPAQPQPDENAMFGGLFFNEEGNDGALEQPEWWPAHRAQPLNNDQVPVEQPPAGFVEEPVQAPEQPVDDEFVLGHSEASFWLDQAIDWDRAVPEVGEYDFMG